MLWTLLSFVLLAIVIYTIYDLWMGQDEQNTKILWTILLVVSNLIGLVLYWFLKKKKN